MKFTLALAFFITLSACGGSSSGNGSDSQAAESMSLIASPSSSVAGGCNGAYVIGIQNSSKQPVAATTDFDISINESQIKNGKIYSDADCETTVTELTIPTGQSQVSFYIKDNVAESFSLTIASSSNNITVTPVVTAGQTAAISVTGPNSAILGECVGPINVETSDTLGNLTSTSNNKITINTTANVQSALAYADSSCQTEISTISTTPITGAFFVQIIGSSNTNATVEVNTGTISDSASFSLISL
jgi:hypothetical protein